ncbi:hypothetical protein F8388_015604 [Cannabis sativa]|uniref:Uncharacterized protein n=1 Tax=Cannabis sativa TaxID=3483 RepID=A0A7J6HJ25_CANSA|nr:hypothetical protein F8388_015604 [Cannabis sativa]
MCHPLMFLWGSQIPKQMLFHKILILPCISLSLRGHYNGLLESVHVAMICRARENYEGCIGLFCPCFLFGKNAEFLGSGTLIGSCTTHFILWGLASTVCCLLTDGLLLGLPVCFVACYACGYRRALRSKYNLQEAPCGDYVTHLFCHLCANCQEYREIRERAGSSTPDLNLAVVTAPPVQTMVSVSENNTNA